MAERIIPATAIPIPLYLFGSLLILTSEKIPEVIEVIAVNENNNKGIMICFKTSIKSKKGKTEKTIRAIANIIKRYKKAINVNIPVNKLMEANG